MIKLYSWFAILGLQVMTASLLMGFRHDANAPVDNYIFNGGLYVAYMAVHYIMMTPGFKKMLTGKPEGGLAERRLYITVSVLTWVAVYAYHKPLPGPVYELPAWFTFVAICGFLVSLIAFVEGTTFGRLKGLVGVPGVEQTHSATAQTKLLTEGSYSSVRHPMYRGAVFMGITSVMIHPHAAQLAWAAVIALTFVVFIPLEEKQLIRARGDEYREFMKRTPYRLFRGIW